MNIKEGTRLFTVAESFDRKIGISVLAAIIYRLDGIIDGVKIGYNTLGGKDSTENIIKIYKEVGREDINIILLSGAIISWFNIVDINELYYRINKPVIVATYEESDGIIPYLIEYFRDWEERVLNYLMLGDRVKIKLDTGYSLYIRSVGIETDMASKIVNKITLSGRMPEPIKIAKMIANSVLRDCIEKYMNNEN